MSFPRRIFLATTTSAAAAAALGVRASAATAASTTPTADLHWLDGPPATPTGSAWGVPWPRGQVAKNATFTLAAADGAPVPVQSWPLAYWPDGSVKWTGHAVTSSATAETFKLAPGTPAAPATPVTVRRSPREIVLSNGTVELKLATTGPTAVPSISRAGRVVARDGELVLRLQDQPDDDGDSRAPRREDWTGIVERADVEQSGPVCAVVKL